MTRTLFALALAALTGCSCLPDWKAEPDAVTTHFHVRTITRSDVALAKHVGALAEEYRAQLATLFGLSPRADRALPILVYNDAAAFEEARGCVELGEHVPGFTVSFVGRDERFACLYWKDEGWSARTLAHELVHDFTAGLLPEDLPTWKDEGLASALAHGAGVATSRGKELWQCPVLACRRFSDDELRVMLGTAMTSRSVVFSNATGALLRFGIETNDWADVRDVVAWEPDVDAFLVWLRETPSDRWHTRLPPVRAGAPSPSAEADASPTPR